ncbi:MAG: MgtC/SapB family protein [Candidatus Kapaibacterium sp.]
MSDWLSQNTDQFNVLLQVLIAMILSSLVGINREMAQKPAGLRTQALVGGASALITGIGDLLLETFAFENFGGVIRSDPFRLINAVITGVSFIGAGTIIIRRKMNDVEGLTTASSLLFSAVVGIAVGSRQYVLAIGATILSILVLIFLKSFSDKLSGKSNDEE